MKNDNAVEHNNQTASEQTSSPDESHALHKVRDPVCGMVILPDKAHSSIRYQDHQLYFCSASCESKFKAHPDHYFTEDASEHHHHHDHHEVSPDKIKQSHRQAEKEISEGVWTCPMHPEIRRSGPGSCPVCGMALEPLVATASTGTSDELRDMTRRFWLGLLLAFPVLILEMGSHLFPALRNTVPPQYNTWLQLLLASPVVLWCGWPFFARAGMSLRNRSLNMFNTCTAIHLERDSDCVNVMITNTMSGQVPANLERLFDRFYRADSSRFYNTEGAGLGLSITRSIIHAHGGELSAEQQGREIVFKVRLLMD